MSKYRVVSFRGSKPTKKNTKVYFCNKSLPPCLHYANTLEGLAGGSKFLMVQKFKSSTWKNLLDWRNSEVL